MLESILTFWFGSEQDDAAVARQQASLWWAKDAAVDAGIRERFEPLLQAECRGEHVGYDGLRERLARIVLLDQLSRNMYRGSAAAFAQDAAARALALAMLQAEQDRQLRPIERVFVYLPFEHSEALPDQQHSVALFTALQASVPAPQRELFASYRDYAERHQQIIARFGRFPHRNAILGRASTAEELAFLQLPGSSF